MDDRTQVIKERIEKKKNKKKKMTVFLKVLSWILIIGVWSGLVYGGFYYSKKYIDESIDRVQQNNSISIQAVTEKLDVLNNEIEGLRQAVSEADSNIASSTNIQGKINEKLNKLDAQLKELEKSLKILKEAP